MPPATDRKLAYKLGLLTERVKHQIENRQPLPSLETTCRNYCSQGRPERVNDPPNEQGGQSLATDAL
jgi:hypothetical protein